MFSEPSPGNFRHTAVSACLAQNEHIQNIALFSTHEISSVIVKLADSLALQQEKKEAGPAAAFDIAYPSFENAFELFNKNADASGRYHNYLNGRVNTSRWSVHHFTTAWDWASVGSGTIIDVRAISMRSLFLNLDQILTSVGRRIFRPHLQGTGSHLSRRKFHCARHEYRCHEIRTSRRLLQP